MKVCNRYVTERENETAYTIAKLLRVDIDALMTANAKGLPELRKSSKLRAQTWLVAPAPLALQTRPSMSSSKDKQKDTKKDMLHFDAEGDEPEDQEVEHEEHEEHEHEHEHEEEEEQEQEQEQVETRRTGRAKASATAMMGGAKAPAPAKVHVLTKARCRAGCARKDAAHQDAAHQDELHQHLPLTPLSRRSTGGATAKKRVRERGGNKCAKAHAISRGAARRRSSSKPGTEQHRSAGSAAQKGTLVSNTQRNASREHEASGTVGMDGDTTSSSDSSEDESKSGNRFASRDAFGIFVYDARDAGEAKSRSGKRESEEGKRVRFANLLLPVVAEVEKVANQTDGRWTRGLHKKTSDHIAEQHLKMLGISQVPSGTAVLDTDGGACVWTPKSILRPFQLHQSQESINVALMRCKMSIQSSVTRGTKKAVTNKSRLNNLATSSTKKSGKSHTKCVAGGVSSESEHVAQVEEEVEEEEDDSDVDSDVENMACVECDSKSQAHSMLLCDGCDDGYHMACIDPPLKVIPEGEWYCTECLEMKNLCCQVCGSAEREDEMMLCDACACGWHLECVSPALSCIPEDDWSLCPYFLLSRIITFCVAVLGLV